MHGPVEEEVRLIAEAHHSDLMILGSHGREGFSARFVIGSKSEALDSPCDLPGVDDRAGGSGCACRPSSCRRTFFAALSLDDHFGAGGRPTAIRWRRSLGRSLPCSTCTTWPNRRTRTALSGLEQEFEASLPRGTIGEAVGAQPVLYSSTSRERAPGGCGEGAGCREAWITAVGVGHANMVSKHALPGRGILPQQSWPMHVFAR